MIEEKDVSTPCDERHSSKNISNVNLSTQKKTGGKCIMGNQGMTNWKFSAFFAIALMLIVGLFGNAAIAANNVNDGAGRVTVTDPEAHAVRGHTLSAGAVAERLAFSYVDLAVST